MPAHTGARSATPRPQTSDGLQARDAHEPPTRPSTSARVTFTPETHQPSARPSTRRAVPATRPSQVPSPRAGEELLLADAVALVETAWEDSGDFTEQTMTRVTETVHRFVRRLNAEGVRTPTEIGADHCRGFIEARTSSGSAPELTTVHARRTALRMLFRTWRQLGVTDGDPTLDIQLPARSITAARPLTDSEITLCRASTRLGEAGTVSLQRATAWALGEATAVSSEISTIRVADIDDPETPRWVHLPGTKRHDPRLGELSDWGARIVARQVQVLRSRHLPPATLLTYRGTGTPGQAKAQAAVCNSLGAVLELAGLANEPDVRPNSLRNWAGRALYDGGMPLEKVARRMGARSLDTVAADLAITWRQP